MLAAAFCLLMISAGGQDKALVNTGASPYAKLSGFDMGQTLWTGGFWGEWFEVSRTSAVPGIWNTYSSPAVSHALKNFEIAAGLDTGSHKGPSFHDGDFYKVLEALAQTFALTRDPQLDSLLDYSIGVIARAQRSDGYIHTPVVIEQLRKPGSQGAFREQLNFETYNLGHLMTAACIHHRATGKRNFLDVAVKATDFLCRFYEHSTPELARNTICPSHYMGITEIYRTTGNRRYLELAANLIDIRGVVSEGTDDNQDRIPFRQQTKAMGHAVRANYLYAGVADVFAETGDSSLFRVLNLIWEDVASSKLYITGACGALYDGVSPDGTSYRPREIQKTHQAYGRSYQLPNITAHNESCANIGNLLWNYRMLQITGDPRYADILEKTLCNSILAGISLDGKRFFYTNPLRTDMAFPYTLRWKKEREEYIALSNCCPPNTVRMLAETANYAYSRSKEGIWVNLYGSSRLNAELPGGGPFGLIQDTEYPWDGKITFRFAKAPDGETSLFLRIPGWCSRPVLRLNNRKVKMALKPGTYAEIRRSWSEEDILELTLPMKVTLMESHPLVEETRNQVAVVRGPLVYCLESPDLPEGIPVSAVSIPEGIRLKPEPFTIDGRHLVALRGKARFDPRVWDQQLYRPRAGSSKKVNLRLIPYYAWNNRGKPEMTVWFPASR